MIQAEMFDLRRVVQDAIDDGRLGSPKFIRCIASASESTQMTTVLDELTSMGESWFGSYPAQRFRMGEKSGVYLTETIKWPQGQSALITIFSVPTKRASQFDLMLIGSRGTLYYEG